MDLLPDEAAGDVIWACQQLYEYKRSQEDIRFELNDRLEAKGIEGISKSAFNRKAARLSRSQRRMREARAMFEGLTDEFAAKDVDQNTLILGEFIKALIQEIAEDGVTSTKQLMELSSAYRATVAGQKISSDRRSKEDAEAEKRKAKEEANAKLEQTIDMVARATGLSADRAADIRKQVLGLRS